MKKIIVSVFATFVLLAFNPVIKAPLIVNGDETNEVQNYEETEATTTTHVFALPPAITDINLSQPVVKEISTISNTSSSETTETTTTTTTFITENNTGSSEKIESSTCESYIETKNTNGTTPLYSGSSNSYRGQAPVIGNQINIVPPIPSYYIIYEDNTRPVIGATQITTTTTRTNNQTLTGAPKTTDSSCVGTAAVIALLSILTGLVTIYNKK